LIEELLRAWNEYRHALTVCAKSGKKLANAMEELGHGVDKTSITGALSRYFDIRDLTISSDVETDSCGY
jgi:hypothetical protein